MKNVIIIKFVMILIIMFFFNTNAKSQYNSKRTRAIAYTIIIPGEKNHDGTYSPAKIYDMYYLNEGEYLPNKIIVKTKNIDILTNNCKEFKNPKLQSSVSKFGILKIRAPFQEYLYTNNNKNERNLKNIDPRGISRIYELDYTSDMNPVDVCKELMNNPEVEYAEPVLLNKPIDFTPNDPDLSSQWHVDKIELKKAWEITRGDTNVLIAIVDTGEDWQHPDLLQNIWTNPKEIPYNGIDDDNNGKTDDIHGWDFVGNINPNVLLPEWEEDNDPKPLKSLNYHGTHVSGCASAVTNNNYGIAGTGFNCKLLPLKCAGDSYYDNVVRTYEAMIYAANQGADIINCSFGRIASPSPSEQDVINTVTDMGCLVVAGAGNESSNMDYEEFYPACYDNVISVGATNEYDKLPSFGNYGYSVSVFAPGMNIYSTKPGSSFRTSSGTSMATPIAAGVCGLIKSANQNFNLKQIEYKLRSSCDIIDMNLPDGSAIKARRINAFKAVAQNPTSDYLPGIGVSNIKFYSSDAIRNYSPITIGIELTNYLSDATNVNVNIISIDSSLNIHNPFHTIGTFESFGQKTIDLQVNLNPLYPWYNGEGLLVFDIESNGKVNREFLKIPIIMDTKNYSWQRGYHASDIQINNAFFLSWDKNLEVGYFSKYGGHISGMTNQGSPVLGSYPLYCGLMTDDTHAYCAGASSSGTAIVYKYPADSGKWDEIIVSSTTGFVNNIWFFDENEGLILGNPKNGNWGIGKSSDGGYNWAPVNSVPAPLSNEKGLLRSFAYKENSVWFGTTSGRIFYSIDRGDSWNVSTIYQDGQVHNITFFDLLKGFAIYSKSSSNSAPRFLAMTSDGGETWTKDVVAFNTFNAKPIGSFSPDSINTLYILFDNGSIFYTKDDGKKWYAELSKKAPQSNFAIAFHNNQEAGALFYGDIYTYALNFRCESKIKSGELIITSNNNYDFGDVEINKTKIDTVVVSNIGDFDVNINKMYFLDTTHSSLMEFKLLSQDFKSIGANSQKELIVEFQPVITGNRYYYFVIFSDDIYRQTYVILKGNGVDGEAVKEPPTNKSLSIIPNPASEYIEINMGANIYPYLREINIYNALGQCLLSVAKDFSEGEAEKIDISNLQAGIYFIRIGDNFEKFMVIR